MEIGEPSVWACSPFFRGQLLPSSVTLARYLNLSFPLWEFWQIPRISIPRSPVQCLGLWLLFTKYGAAGSRCISSTCLQFLCGAEIVTDPSQSHGDLQFQHIPTTTTIAICSNQWSSILKFQGVAILPQQSDLAFGPWSGGRLLALVEGTHIMQLQTLELNTGRNISHINTPAHTHK